VAWGPHEARLWGSLNLKDIRRSRPSHLVAQNNQPLHLHTPRGTPNMDLSSWRRRRRSSLAHSLDWILALHIVPRIRYLGFSHFREEGSLDYDGGFVRLQIQMNFDTTINRQQPHISTSDM
jgi:hypothetical protein